jgi:hypothetical protein
VTTRRTKSTAVADFEAKAKAAQAAFDAACAVRQQRADDLAAAEQALAAVHAAWESGDDSVPADAEVQAQAQLSRASRLLAAAEAVERKAQAQLLNTDVRLAEALAPFVTAVLRVAPTVQPLRSADVASELPSCVIVQERATTVDPRNGSLSGAVEVIFSRGELHREAEAQAFEAAAERHDVVLSDVQVYTDQHGDTFRDVVHLRVASLDLPVPVLLPATDTVSAARELGRDVVSAVSQATRKRLSDDMPRRPMDDGWRIGVATAAGAPVVLSNSMRRGGSKPGQADTRHVTVEMEFTARPGDSDSRWDSQGASGAAAIVGDAVEKQRGNVVPGLGRVTSAGTVGDTRVVDTTESGRPKAIAVRARFELVCQPAKGADLGDTDSPARSSVPAQRRRSARDPLEDLDGTGSHPGTVAAQ